METKNVWLKKMFNNEINIIKATNFKIKHNYLIKIYINK